MAPSEHFLKETMLDEEMQCTAIDKGRTTKRVTGSIAGGAEHVYANNDFVYRKM